MCVRMAPILLYRACKALCCRADAVLIFDAQNWCSSTGYACWSETRLHICFPNSRGREEGQSSGATGPRQPSYLNRGGREVGRRRSHGVTFADALPGAGEARADCEDEGAPRSKRPVDRRCSSRPLQNKSRKGCLEPTLYAGLAISAPSAGACSRNHQTPEKWTVRCLGTLCCFAGRESSHLQSPLSPVPLARWSF